MAGVLLHRPGGDGGRYSGNGVGPIQFRNGVPRRERGGRRGSTAGAVRGGERGVVPPVPVDLHDDGVLGMGVAGGPVGPPPAVAVGRPGPAAQSRGQAAGVAAGIARGGNNRSSARQRHRPKTHGRPPTPPRLGGLNQGFHGKYRPSVEGENNGWTPSDRWPRSRKECTMCRPVLSLTVLLTCWAISSPADPSPAPNDDFEKVLGELRESARRVNGVELNITAESKTDPKIVGGVIHIKWTLDYTGPRPPLVIQN